jgi:predicted nucleic acid-binding protein
LYISLGIDFVDAYHATLLAHYQQLELYSFDTDFDKVPGIRRREPAQP